MSARKPDEITLLSRRGFLAAGTATGGGLIVAASIPGVSLLDVIVRDASAAAGEVFIASSYVEIAPDGQITITIGKSEMGQGTLTGIAQLIGDELGCRWDDIRIRQAPVDKAYGFPHNGFMVTGGSTGLRSEWTRMRQAGAAARMMLEQAAAKKWKVDAAALSVKDGVISGPGGKRAGFGEMARHANGLDLPKSPPLKAKTDRTFIGKPMKRLDTAAKTTGKAGYGVDVNVPGMLTAIVIFPPKRGAAAKSFKAKKALARPGVVAVVKIPSGVAILAKHYWAAHSARDDVEIEWGKSPLAGVGMETIRKGYREALGKSGMVAETKGDVAKASAKGAGNKTITRVIEQPYLAHACMEPMNFTVWIKPDGAEVWGPTQAQSWVQGTVAKVAGIDAKSVAVHTTFLGGGFGRRSSQDFVRVAAEVAKAAGTPVKTMYSREDDMRNSPYRPFNLTRASGTLDKAGTLTALDFKIATPSVSRHAGATFMIKKNGLDPHTVEGLVRLPYDVPNTRVEWVEHDPKIPVHFWRSVAGSHNPYAVETLMDELAEAAGKEPLAFRRGLLTKSPRHLAVIDHLARDAGWDKAVPKGVGRGMAIAESFGSIVAEAAEVRLVDGALKVERVTCVIDCGVAINPGQIEAQMQGSIVFGLSALLRGEITFEDGEVEQSNFHDYEPLRMPEMPEVVVRILESGDKPGGIGEPGVPPLLPAVANALRALTGKRIEKLPFVA